MPLTLTQVGQDPELVTRTRAAPPASSPPGASPARRSVRSPARRDDSAHLSGERRFDDDEIKIGEAHQADVLPLSVAE